MQETDHVHEDIHPQRPTRPTRARLFTIAAVASGLGGRLRWKLTERDDGWRRELDCVSRRERGRRDHLSVKFAGLEPKSGATRSELAELRQVHAGQRRSKLPRPEARSGIALPRLPGARLRGRAGEVSEAAAQRGGAAAVRPAGAGAAAPDRSVHAPARRPGLSRPRKSSRERPTKPAGRQRTRSPITTECSSRSRPRSTSSRQRFRRRRLRGGGGFLKGL